MKSKYYLNLLVNIAENGKYFLAVSVISFVSVALRSRSGTAVCGLCTKCECGAERKIAEYWGLDGLRVERFLAWGNSLLHGDFGVPLLYRRPVLDIIKEKFVASLALMLTAWVFSGVFGFAMGCIMEVFHGRLAG